MERFYFEVPGIERKDEALAYINEFYEYKSNINGAGGLAKFLKDYEGWLRMSEAYALMNVNPRRCPAREFFLVRESDNRIVGMINIRIALNEKNKKYGGHIGYSIRPTERGKGYNNINLYLGLKVCNQYGIETVFMDADLDNPASWKTMEAFGSGSILMTRTRTVSSWITTLTRRKHSRSTRNTRLMWLRFDWRPGDLCCGR